MVEEIVESNPAATIKKPARERERDRCHSIAELREIWQAASTLEYPFGPLYHLLIALPMRRDGVAAISVPELVLDTGDGVWTLPSDRTKTSKALRIPPLLGFHTRTKARPAI